MTYGVSTESEDELWFASTCAASTAANFLCSNFSNSLKESCHCARQTAEISGETSLRVSFLLGVKKNRLLFTSPHKKTVVGFWRPELCGASKNRPIQNSFRLKFPSNSMFFFCFPGSCGYRFSRPKLTLYVWTSPTMQPSLQDVMERCHTCLLRWPHRPGTPSVPSNYCSKMKMKNTDDNLFQLEIFIIHFDILFKLQTLYAKGLFLLVFIFFLV